MYRFDLSNSDSVSVLAGPTETGERRSGSQNSFSCANQFLPGYWTHLSKGDLERIHQVLDAHLSMKQASRATLEACLMVEALLSTGRRFADMYSIEIRRMSEKGARFCVSPPGLIFHEGNWSWWLPSGGPDRISLSNSSLMKPVVPNVCLPVTRRLLSILTQLLSKRRIRSVTQPAPLFEQPEEAVAPRVRALLSGCLRTTGKPRRAATTIESAERWLLSALAHSSGGDLNAASVITSRRHSVARPMTHYGCSSVERTVKTYKQTISQFSPLSHERYPASLAGMSVGDPATPSDKAVRSLIAELGRRLGNQQASLAERHAAMTDYTVALLSFALALRGTGEVPGIGGVDGATGFANICDKNAGSAGSHRLTWVCETARKQLELYERHLDLLGECLTPSENIQLKTIREQSGLKLPLVKLTRRNRPTSQRLSHVYRALKRNSWPGDSNAGRHWVRAKLSEKCSQETLAAFLGHGQSGAYSWSVTSSLDPLLYRADLKRSLDTVLNEAGWRAQPGPLSDPTTGSDMGGPRVIFGSDILPIQLAALGKNIAPDPGMSPAARAGQLLASAIFHGALLDRRYWSRWLEAAFRGPVKADDIVWLDLDPLHPEGGGTASQGRRWFADPITRTLLGSWYGRGGMAPQAMAEDCLIEYLNGNRGDRTVVDTLLRHAERRWRLRMPPLLFSHAKGDHDAVPPETNDWLRLLGLEFAVRKPENRSREYRCRIWCAEEASILAVAKEECTPTTTLTAKRAAEEAFSDLACTTPGQALLNRWCRDALTTERGKQQDGLMPSTILGYLGCLCEHVIDPGDDLDAMSAGQLIEHLFNRLSAMKPSSRRGVTRKAVVSLFNSLSKYRDDLPSLPTAFNRFRFGSRVSAKLVSPAEFARALQSCRSSDQRLCLILGFRCGLRLSEALGLTVDDFSVTGNAFELTVIRNRIRDLKTPQSRRVLPLHVLLEQAEIEMLKDRIANKVRERGIARGRDLIFSHADLVDGIRDARTPKWALEQIIAKATGVQLTFHHLRHSFASYLMATLLLPDDHPAPPIPEALTDVISKERKSRLAAPLLGEEKLGQHALHAISQLMGHIVNETTVQWYGHLLDLVRLHYIARPAAEAGLAQKAVLALTAVSRPLPPLGSGDRKPANSNAVWKEGYRKPIIEIEDPEFCRKQGLLLVSTQRGRKAAGWERNFINPRPMPLKVHAANEPQDLVPGLCWRTIAAALMPEAVGSEVLHPKAPLWQRAAENIQALEQKSGAVRHALNLERRLGSPRWIAYLDSRWPFNRPLNAKERRALFAVIDGWDPSRDGVRFSGRPKAVTYRDLLLDCGFMRSEIEVRLTGERFRHLAGRDLHAALESADWLPGCARTRGMRGTIGIHFRGDGEDARHVRSAGHYLLVMLAIREGYGVASDLAA